MTKDGFAVVINIDGGARGNPGPAGAGIVIRSADDDTVLFTGGEFLGRQTNNVAEYSALLAGLKAAAKIGAGEVLVLSDSELLVRQMTGRYRVKNLNLKKLYDQAQDLLENFSRCKFDHVRREQNTDADRLANQAMNLKANVDDSAEF